MKTSLHRIITKDDLELVGLLYEPEDATKKVLVHVHGMAGNFYDNKFVDVLAKTLTDSGIAFFSFNNRGCEYIKDLVKIEDGKRGIVRIGDTYEKFDDCILDIQAGIDFVESRGFSEIHVSGHSLGAPKVAYYTSLTQDPRLASIIFLSPADMVGLAKEDENYERDVVTVNKMITQGIGNEILPFLVWDDNYLTANSYMSISDEKSKVAVFNFYNPEDKLEVLGKINIPVLTVRGRQDFALTITADETVNAMKKALNSSTKIETNILGDADHGFNNYEQQLADIIKSWIQKT
jgi:alpha-beta hydrolase superfamily lysophospholipase